MAMTSTLQIADPDISTSWFGPMITPRGIAATRAGSTAASIAHREGKESTGIDIVA
jgi:hypothetical protein